MLKTLCFGATVVVGIAAELRSTKRSPVHAGSKSKPPI